MRNQVPKEKKKKICSCFDECSCCCFLCWCCCCMKCRSVYSLREILTSTHFILVNVAVLIIFFPMIIFYVIRHPNLFSQSEEILYFLYDDIQSNLYSLHTSNVLILDELTKSSGFPDFQSDLFPFCFYGSSNLEVFDHLSISLNRVTSDGYMFNFTGFFRREGNELLFYQNQNKGDLSTSVFQQSNETVISFEDEMFSTGPSKDVSSSITLTKSLSKGTCAYKYLKTTSPGEIVLTNLCPVVDNNTYFGYVESTASFNIILSSINKIRELNDVHSHQMYLEPCILVLTNDDLVLVVSECDPYLVSTNFELLDVYEGFPFKNYIKGLIGSSVEKAVENPRSVSRSQNFFYVATAITLDMNGLQTRVVSIDLAQNQLYDFYRRVPMIISLMILVCSTSCFVSYLLSNFFAKEIQKPLRNIQNVLKRLSFKEQNKYVRFESSFMSDIQNINELIFYVYHSLSLFHAFLPQEKLRQDGSLREDFSLEDDNIVENFCLDLLDEEFENWEGGGMDWMKMGMGKDGRSNPHSCGSDNSSNGDNMSSAGSDNSDDDHIFSNYSGSHSRHTEEESMELELSNRFISENRTMKSSVVCIMLEQFRDTKRFCNLLFEKVFNVIDSEIKKFNGYLISFTEFKFLIGFNIYPNIIEDHEICSTCFSLVVNKKFCRLGIKKFSVGISNGDLHTGFVGSSENKQSVVVGDCKKIASLLCSYGLEYNEKIVVSESILKRIISTHEKKQVDILIFPKLSLKPVKVFILYRVSTQRNRNRNRRINCDVVMRIWESIESNKFVEALDIIRLNKKKNEEVLENIGNTLSITPSSTLRTPTSPCCHISGGGGKKEEEQQQQQSNFSMINESDKKLFEKFEGLIEFLMSSAINIKEEIDLLQRKCHKHNFEIDWCSIFDRL